MPDGNSARDRFERLAYVVSRSSREDGADLAALAKDLGTTQARILQDLQEVETRDEYRPGGWTGDIKWLVKSGRIRVDHTSFMERPFKLTDREMFCLALSVRGVMSEADDDRPASSRTQLAVREEAGRPPKPGASEDSAAGLDDFLHRAQSNLSQNPGSAAAPSLAVPNRIPDDLGIRDTLKTAVYEHRPCVVTYLKPGAERPSRRVIHPYLVLYSEETWYVVALCTATDEERVFRVDRVLSAEHTEGRFDVPDDFDAQAYLKRGPDGLMLAPKSREARVRYSQALAPWVKERASYRSVSMEEHDDGSITVRHSVADPYWLAAHVLRYGIHAEVLEPQDLRDMVAELARGMARAFASPVRG